MYKITLYDYNCSPICDGVVSFFAQDIDDFQARWLASGRVDEARKERFLRSKAGELVTDWYDSEDPALNIVRQGEAAVYGQKTVVLDDVTFESFNAYRCSSTFHVNRWTIHFKWIAFQGEYHRIASFQADGVCQEGLFVDRLEDVECYGNPVLENTVKYAPQYNRRVDPSLWDNPGFGDFAENKIQTICWLVNGTFADLEALKEDLAAFEVTPEIMDWLFADVVGEAG